MDESKAQRLAMLREAIRQARESRAQAEWQKDRGGVLCEEAVITTLEQRLAELERDETRDEAAG